MRRGCLQDCAQPANRVAAHVPELPAYQVSALSPTLPCSGDKPGATAADCKTSGVRRAASPRVCAQPLFGRSRRMLSAGCSRTSKRAAGRDGDCRLPWQRGRLVAEKSSTVEIARAVG